MRGVDGRQETNDDDKYEGGVNRRHPQPSPPRGSAESVKDRDVEQYEQPAVH